MAAKILTLHNAELNTASISIRTLQIEGKQVTLAVFRQLLSEDIVNADISGLNGTPWGFVNYLIERTGEIHVVWQKRIDLRRCLVRMKTIGNFWFRPRPHSDDMGYGSFQRANENHAREKTAAFAEHEALRERTERYNALVTPLFDLPQLFIAV